MDCNDCADKSGYLSGYLYSENINGIGISECAGLPIGLLFCHLPYLFVLLFCIIGPYCAPYPPVEGVLVVQAVLVGHNATLVAIEPIILGVSWG